MELICEGYSCTSAFEVSSHNKQRILHVSAAQPSPDDRIAEGGQPEEDEASVVVSRTAKQKQQSFCE
jgi:hypothetical protein